jgi:hypothetical protein
VICEQARLAIGATPDQDSAELKVHLAGCPACREFGAETRALNDRIRRALQLSPPGMVEITGAANVAGRPIWRRAWALAAAVLLAVTALILVRPSQSNTALAAEIVAHVADPEEATSWENTEIVAAGVLDRVLHGAGVEIDTAGSEKVVYAHSCVLRGRSVPHLVLRTSSGPLTVLPLVGESLSAEQVFNENGLSGVLLPQPGGAIAVLGRGPADVRALARELAQKIRLRPK